MSRLLCHWWQKLWNKISRAVKCFIERIYGTVEWIESFGPNYWDLHWRPREAGIENRFYVCPQWGPFPLLSPGTKWGRLLAIGESISSIVPQCGLIDDMCHTMNHSEWRHEHIFQQPLLLSPHFDNSYLEIVKMLTWKEWSWSFDVIYNIYTGDEQESDWFGASLRRQRNGWRHFPAAAISRKTPRAQHQLPDSPTPLFVQPPNW